jgi:hypothetical protein
MTNPIASCSKLQEFMGHSRRLDASLPICVPDRNRSPDARETSTEKLFLFLGAPHRAATRMHRGDPSLFIIRSR